MANRSKPCIDWTDEETPVLICRDNTIHPLTKFELIMLNMGIYSLEFLDRKYNSEPQRGA